MKLGWLSDIHLNFLDNAGRSRFFDDLSARDVQGWLLSGDIGEADSVASYLREFGDRLAVPTYFVLGNHDFYGGSLAGVGGEVAAMSSASSRLAWLTDVGPIRLDEMVMVVGDDSWGDGRLGNPMGSPVELNDFYFIKELTGHGRADLVSCLNRLGEAAAVRLEAKLHTAAAACRNVVVVLHVPPFEGASWHEGKISSPDWLPWFCCGAVGLVLADVAAAYPDTDFTVFCGHTHSRGQFSPSPNMTVHTASAEYYRPGVQAVIEF
jgi:hypothetical protein